MNKKKLDSSELGLGKVLWDISRTFEDQDRITRQRQILRWKKYDFFWRSIQYLLDAEKGFGYQSPNLNPEEDQELASYTKVYNITKAHGESIIAALSVDYPSILFPPDDAENPNDVETSAAFDKIHELLKKQNHGKLLLIQALYYIYTCGIVFSHTCPKESRNYGTYQVPEYDIETSKVCPDCNIPMNGSCPSCGFEGEGEEVEVPVIKGYQTRNKQRQIIKVYSPLNVMVPTWLKVGDQIPYLRFSEDIHEAEAKYEYQEVADQISSHDDMDQWEQWGRESYESQDYGDGLVTKRSIWFAPCSYFLAPEESRDELLKKYPNGIKVVFIHDLPVELVHEDLNDVWAISCDPRTRHIHADAICSTVVPINEVVNETFNLTIQSVEHGIPQTFVDSETLDLQKYRESEARPGQIYPVKNRPGRPLSESFETIKTASISQEIDKFADRLEQMGQFVVGSFPSIYGGRIEGSRTAAEYNMSRQQSLQRLSTSWTIVSHFWADSMRNACSQFVKNMQTDERFTRKEGNSYVNVWIRKIQLQGTIGQVEPEIVEQFPISSAQKRDFIIQLFEAKDPAIMQVLFHPANRAIVSRYVGFSDLYIPGENDQNKQYTEIEELLKGKPIEIPDEQGNVTQSIPSVRTDSQLDDDLVHIQTCKAVLTSERGRLIRQENPDGWNNILAHMIEHEMNLQSKTQDNFQGTPQGEVPETATTTTGG